MDLQCAGIQMQRALANAGTDPVSGFTADEIAEAVEARYAPLELVRRQDRPGTWHGAG